MTHDTELAEAWEIINVLVMMDIDRDEPWPRALRWLERNEQYRKSPHIISLKPSMTTLDWIEGRITTLEKEDVIAEGNWKSLNLEEKTLEALRMRMSPGVKLTAYRQVRDYIRTHPEQKTEISVAD